MSEIGSQLPPILSLEFKGHRPRRTVIAEFKSQAEVDCALNKKSVQIGFDSHRLERPHAPTPPQCPKCHAFGHIAEICDAVADTCRKCSGAHRTSECTSTDIRCARCGKTDHTASSRRCKRQPHNNPRSKAYRPKSKPLQQRTYASMVNPHHSHPAQANSPPPNQPSFEPVNSRVPRPQPQSQPPIPSSHIAHEVAKCLFDNNAYSALEILAESSSSSLPTHVFGEFLKRIPQPTSHKQPATLRKTNKRRQIGSPSPVKPNDPSLSQPESSDANAASQNSSHSPPNQPMSPSTSDTNHDNTVQPVQSQAATQPKNLVAAPQPMHMTPHRPPVGSQLDTPTSSLPSRLDLSFGTPIAPRSHQEQQQVTVPDSELQNMIAIRIHQAAREIVAHLTQQKTQMASQTVPPTSHINPSSLPKG